MKTLGIVSQKGGAGKTTVAVHLAVLAESAGMKVAIMDADPQHSAAAWWQRRAASTPAMIERTPADLAAVQQQVGDAGVELLIVDSAPAHGDDVSQIARQSNFVLIPSRPTVLDLNAIGRTIDLVAAIGVPAAVLLNAVAPGRGRESSITDARQALKESPVPVAPVSIGQRAALSHALIDGRTIVEFEPRSKAAAEFRDLWKWLKKEMKV